MQPISFQRAAVCGIVTPDGRVVVQNLINSDPPDHTRLRSLVSKAFTARCVKAMQPRVHRLTHELIDAFPPSGQVELIAEFAHPLPLIINCELLGIPVEPARHFHGWWGDSTYPCTWTPYPLGNRV